MKVKYAKTWVFKICTILFLLLIIIAIFLVFIFFFDCKISPKNLTISRIMVLERRICEYAEKHGGKFPQTLVDLPLKEGYDNSINDGWGNPIDYAVESRKVTIKSLGSDRKVGGEGDCEDLIRTFTLSDNITNNIDGWPWKSRSP